MKKVGIITLYHNNSNYGGLLQAYALPKVLKNVGIEAEQICTDFISDDDSKFMPKRPGVKGAIRNTMNRVIYFIHKKDFASRRQSFKMFEKMIPHSETIYDHDTITKCNNEYEAFITGSDQVWNLLWFQPEYFLSFVPNNKRKISYAASMPDNKPNNQQIELIKKFLVDFDAISVRENSTVDMFLRLLDIKAESVLDPTLLLEELDWDAIEETYPIPQKFIFCYFLGGSRVIRNIAKDFAKQMNLKIVTLPHIGSVNISDCLFGDYRLYDVTPGQFIHLIKRSSYVITDSFHAAVFSNIYKKKYYVMPRIGQESMNTRIISLLNIYNAKDRFIKVEQGTDALMKLVNIELPYGTEELYNKVQSSRNFLIRNLKPSTL